jgi:alkyldihydroxyacetonephosphate synthase
VQPRRSLWMWGLESEEPTEERRREVAAALSARFGVELRPPRIPSVDELELRAPRVRVPSSLAAFCSQDTWERAYHSYGFDRCDHAPFGRYPNPPDAVAHPRSEVELEATLEWCCERGYCVIPYGGGSSVVGGVTPPEDRGPVVTVSLDQFDRVLEVDDVSRAARIQAGVFGPALEDQLRPMGLTLRHFPQSFTGSTLGGWIATRSGGHYATNHTHIDEFVESVRMLTPEGWLETRRLPGSGAGPDPNRLVIGSEGILGIITEAWMRVQARPRFRATAGVRFSSWEAGSEATRRIVQAKLWPANLRLLDPDLAAGSAGVQGGQALLIIGFESAEVPQRAFLDQAVALARACGGVVSDDELVVDDGTGQATGRAGAVGAWRQAFIPGSGGLGGANAGLGLVAGTFETAITWDRWPEFDHAVRTATLAALTDVCGGGSVNCRFTHVYTDGPAPYYTYLGAYRSDADPLGQHAAIKAAASEAILAAGGTITHHHAVGRQHRPWYDRERPELFGEALRAAKRAVDPQGIMNPGVLVDPLEPIPHASSR